MSVTSKGEFFYLTEPGKQHHSAAYSKQNGFSDNNDSNERGHERRVGMHFNIINLWHVTQCNLVDSYHRFGEICCLQIHGRKREVLGSRLHTKNGV
jgi:hypothetical protein